MGSPDQVENTTEKYLEKVGRTDTFFFTFAIYTVKQTIRIIILPARKQVFEGEILINDSIRKSLWHHINCAFAKMEMRCICTCLTVGTTGVPSETEGNQSMSTDTGVDRLRQAQHRSSPDTMAAVATICSCRMDPRPRSLWGGGLQSQPLAPPGLLAYGCQLWPDRSTLVVLDIRVLSPMV
ncbi:hypothetical protein E5288_WYG012106 [Bos mutus]|uniref:Uncharacterized protein n=1 Tax=Bos mutus TaxID=72004 RepID=A0A6B0R1P7_9CETA|nr:hypothetical protein [Bos mutus]